MAKEAVKIHTVGGFSEVGKNMVVVELEDDAFLKYAKKLKKDYFDKSK